MPHIPVSTSPAFRGSSDYSVYGDAVKEIDWSVGQLLDCLKDYGLDRNTLTVFTSDNGPALHTKYPGGSAGNLRGSKSTCWEGGVRVPCIARWPGRIPNGVERRGISCLMDLFTTAVSVAHAAIPTDRAIDGVDLMPWLENGPPPRRLEYFYYFGAHLCAVRAEKWKLHLFKRIDRGARKPGHLVKCDPPELYNLDTDPDESHDIAAQHLDVVETLQQITAEFQSAVEVGKLPGSHIRSLLPRLHRNKRNQPSL
jgi:arylsulfatase A-like enzyme